jgi:hypothetical protein
MDEDTEVPLHECHLKWQFQYSSFLLAMPRQHSDGLYSLLAAFRYDNVEGVYVILEET